MTKIIDNVAVGNRIRAIRNRMGLTTEKFGELFTPKASKGTVSKWENGRYLPNNERLVVIAEKGNITVEELLYGSIEEYLKSVINENRPQLEEMYKISEGFEIPTLLGEFIDTIKNPLEETGIYYPSPKETLDYFDRYMDTVDRNTNRFKLAYDLFYINESLSKLLEDMKDNKLKEYLTSTLNTSESAIETFEELFSTTIEEEMKQISEIKKNSE